MVAFVNYPAKDRAFLEAGLQQLEAYLLSKELYWLSSAPTTDCTQVTLGALLLVRERLKGWKSPGLTELTMGMDAIRLKWRSAWDAKAQREVRARSELWKNYLVELRHAPVESARKYPYEARLRVMLSLLLDDLRESPSDVLAVLDEELRRIWQPGAFVWDVALEPIFPQESFWFLYGNLITGETR
jgi:hypothetical protein